MLAFLVLVISYILALTNANSLFLFHFLFPHINLLHPFSILPLSLFSLHLIFCILLDGAWYVLWSA
jgi:hypothetical protein